MSEYGTEGQTLNDPGAIYGEAFFKTLNTPSHRSLMASMGQSLAEHVKPSSAVEFGCGLGTLVRNLVDAGVNAHGYEAPWSEPFVRRLAPEAEPYVSFLDLASYEGADSTDLSIAVEVAEHLPKGTGPAFVDMLVRSGRSVWFSAAFPGQGGDGHTNEMPMPYWSELFRARGYDVDEETTRAVRYGYDRWVGHEWWYRAARLYRSRR